jgi:hypothetical protein
VLGAVSSNEQVGRDRGDRPVLRHGQVFGVCPEAVLAEAEHPLAGLEGGDVAADRLDPAGELASEDRRLGLREAAEEPNDPRVGCAGAAVRSIHRRRVHPDEHLVRRGGRPLDVHDPNDVGRSVPRVHGGLHAGQL